MEFWPALELLADRELTSDRPRWLLETLDLEEIPRAEGPGADMSIAHRSLTDAAGARLIRDLGRLEENGWVGDDSVRPGFAVPRGIPHSRVALGT